MRFAAPRIRPCLPGLLLLALACSATPGLAQQKFNFTTNWY
jgi:hypothetical protein